MFAPLRLLPVLESTHLRMLVAGLVAFVALPGCSDDPVEERESDAAAFGCEAASGAACGAACSPTVPCPTGLFCSSLGTCGAVCTQASECGAGRTCSASGACVALGDAGQISVDGLDLDGQGATAGATCVEANVDFDPVIPQVWLLLDRSSSMEEVLSGTQRRWDAMGSVLVGDPTDPLDRGVVGEFESQVAFGATFFSRESSESCSALILEETPLSLGNYQAVSSLYQSLQPGTGTPTAEAYADLAERVAVAPETSGPKIIIAATDGAPTKCGAGDAQLDVEDAVALAFTQAITTFVINVGDNDSDASHLQRVANLGQGLASEAVVPAEYYSAANQESLKEAFRSIVRSAVSCVFELNGNVTPASAAQGTVELTGQALVHDDPNGWVLRTSSSIEIVGAACTTIQAGVSEQDLTIQFPCGVFVPK